MAKQTRVVKVLVALLVSMTTGAVMLMALGNHPPSAGPFCLSSFYRLDPIDKAIGSRACQSPNRWNCIEIYYSGTRAGNIEQLSGFEGFARPEDLNCHFVLYNGRGGDNGEIAPTEKWQKQWSVMPGRNWYGTGQTIRICIVCDGKTIQPTDYQIKRLELLVDALCRKFNIPQKTVYYPRDCQ
jgi:hypothetical protein